MKKKPKKRKKTKKCKHPIDKIDGDQCSACGFMEGTCSVCGKDVFVEFDETGATIIEEV